MDNKYKLTCFWIQNEKLKKENIKFHADFLSNLGYGGGFFHSSTGLELEYLSEDWFEAFGNALNSMKENNGYVWIYDEDTWPSGNAGGKIASTEEYRAKCLKVEFVPIGDKPNTCDNEFLCAYKLKGRKYFPPKDNFDTNEFNFSPEIEDFTIINEKEAFEDTSCERLVVRSEYGPKSTWWGGKSYANLLNEEAVSEFVNITHEKYKEHFKDEFGKGIPGVFTDEPQLMSGFNLIAFWDEMSVAYKEKYGISLWEDLPYMFFNHAKAFEARLRINRLISDRFLTNFDKRIYDWCQENNLQLTGHYNAEDTFLGQINNQYGSIMGHYRYNHIPGIDHLCNQTEGITGSLNDTFISCIQATSVANQLGKKRVLDEMWGVTRNTCTLNDFKWLNDNDIALGINFLVPSAAFHTIKGRRKKMYPPVVNYQQPFVHYMKPLVSYLNNLTDLLSKGTSKADILVINTIESAVAINKKSFYSDFMSKDSWTYHKHLPSDINRENSTDVEKIDRDFRKVLHSVYDLGYTCEIGEESYIEEIGSVKNNNFIIGKRNYKVLILPTCITLRQTTIDKIKEFVANKGILIVVGKCFVDEINNLQNIIHCPNAKVQIEHTIDKVYKTDYLLRDKNFKPLEKTLINVRNFDNKSYYFITNRDRFFTKECIFESKYKYLYKIDPINMETYKVPTISYNNKTRYNFSLLKGDSILLLGSNEIIPYKEKKIEFSPTQIIELNNPKIERLHENICVCDQIIYSFDNGNTWSDKEEICLGRHNIAKHFGLEGVIDDQPYRHKNNTKGGPVKIKFFFNSIIEKDCLILFEDINNGTVTLNGKELDFNNNIKRFDNLFRLAPCHIEKGLNIIEHSFDFNYHTEVEKVLILGDFACNFEKLPTISEAKPLEFGSIINQGMPFYCNELKYSFNVNLNTDRAVLNLKNCVANGFKVIINNNEIFSFKENIDISDYIVKGENQIDIYLVFSLQNTFGPIHDKDGNDTIYVRWNAYDNEKLKVDHYVLFDYGLGGAEILLK